MMRPIRRLKDCCIIKPPKSEARKALSEIDPVSFVPMSNLGINTKDIELNEDRALSAVSGSYTYFAEDDVLLAKITPCFENGKLGIARGLTNGIGFGSSEFIVFRSKGEILPDYLYYFLLRPTFRDLGKLAMTGAVGHKRVSKEFIENIEIPLPPLSEQKSIVALLDNTFADIDKAHANAKQNLANSRELFESSLKNIFQNKGAKWEKISLLELLERKWITSHLDGNHGGNYPRKSEFLPSGIPYISAKCIINSNVDMRRAKFLSKEKAGTLSKGVAKNNDVLFAHNATVGPVAILKTKEEKVILGTSLTYYRCNIEHIIPEYLAQYMVSYEFTSQYTTIMRQSTRNQVPITKQREFIHIIPPVNEQAQIARELANLSKELERLEVIYKKKLAALEQLKSALLHKAFTGQLTASTTEAATNGQTA